MFDGFLGDRICFELSKSFGSCAKKEINVMPDIRFLLKTHYTNSRALVIGINEYKSASPLSYAVSDAEEIRDILIKEFSFLGENVTFLKNKQATKENILRAFMRFANSDVDIDERLFVFFAGHGHTKSGIRGEVGFLVPYDADMSDYSTFIRWKELTENAEIIRAKHVLFIMDACYGGLALTRNTYMGSTRFLKDMLLRISRQVITAGKADEAVADSGGPLPGHSVFTGHLIEGLRGKAATEDGVMTASGLMAYVYRKVANDKNSNQTPHFGYFDGDGDFILRASHLEELEREEEKDIDRLVVIPAVEEEILEDNTLSKVKKVKALLASELSSIELHDYLIEEVRRFLSSISEDGFSMQEEFSKEKLLERISHYENISYDLSTLLACVSYWAQPNHKGLLQKVFSRLADRIDFHGGLTVWLNLKWFPLIISLYSAGIAAVEGKRYDSLVSIFYTLIGQSEYRSRGQCFAEEVAQGILELSRNDVFKQLPGHEKNFVPMSEYLFKILQPRLDDILFVGKSYERCFDDFEVLFALVVADLKKQHHEYVWGPIGRFGWKQRYGASGAPLLCIINEAKIARERWGPIREGLFGGNIEKFLGVAEEYQKNIVGLNW